MVGPKLKFAEGEKVLCFHGPLIYEAKCLKSTISKEKHVRYYIHYAGWNKNWDEWVPESRVLKYNEANLQRQKEVQKAHSVLPNRVKRGGKDADATTTINVKGAKSQSRETPVDSGSDQPKKKRARTDLSIESEEQYLFKVEVRIKIPEELRLWLVDDWDVVTRQTKLALLPAKVTINQIMDNYIAFKKSSKAHSQAKEQVLTDLTAGLKEYFNVTLGSQLLYRYERPQYADILQNHPNKQMSAIYGAVHLLRMFTKLGSMLAYTSLDERALQHLNTHMQDFLKYIVANRSSLLNLQDYDNATPEYHRRAVQI